MNRDSIELYLLCLVIVLCMFGVVGFGAVAIRAWLNRRRSNLSKRERREFEADQIFR